MSARSPITTHVLDVGTGRPAAAVAVRLERQTEGRWELLAEGQTNEDGRLVDWFQAATPPGVYRLSFDTDAYYDLAGKECFYPEVCISFCLSDPQSHHHVPLLLNQWGYSTYRGS